jgi:hypothetical protein
MNDTDIDEAVNLKAVYNEQSRLMLPDLAFWDVNTLLDCLSQSRNRHKPHLILSSTQCLCTILTPKSSRVWKIKLLS